MELFEILTDYLRKPALARRYAEDPLNYDGWQRFRDSEDLNALWTLVPKVPATLSHALIENLPITRHPGIPPSVVEAMNDHQLEALLFRRDVGLAELRHQKFFASSGNDENDLANDGLRNAAICFNFDLTNEEVATILAKADKQRVRDLAALAMMATDLRLCVFEAVHDALFVSQVGLADYQNAEFAKRSFLSRLEKLKDWQREKELLELKLYRLAVLAVPWKKGKQGYSPSGELAFLKESIVEGDTWATFVAFLKRWGEGHYGAKGLDGHLPKIWEAGEQEDHPHAEEQADNTEQIADRIASKLTDHITGVPQKPEDGTPSVASMIDLFLEQRATTENAVAG